MIPNSRVSNWPGTHRWQLLLQSIYDASRDRETSTWDHTETWKQTPPRYDTIFCMPESRARCSRHPITNFRDRPLHVKWSKALGIKWLKNYTNPGWPCHIFNIPSTWESPRDGQNRCWRHSLQLKHCQLNKTYNPWHIYPHVMMTVVQITRIVS